MDDQMRHADTTDRYIHALGLQRRKPDLAFLTEISSRHVAQFAFSSVGPQGPARPVGMSGKESHDGFRLFRIAQCRSGEFHMQTLQDGEFFSLYKFELARYGQADCELGHFYSHKHPKASFVNHLVVSKIMDNEIRSLRNREYTVISKSGEQKELIEGLKHLKSILDKQFDIRVTEAEGSRLFA